MSKSAMAAVFLALMLFGCSAQSPQPSNEMPGGETANNPADFGTGSDVPETKNVIYRGIVKPAGISIYQQGSHRLMLEDGRFILLESQSVDLNGYVGESVEAAGAIRPTVEEGGMILRVESARLIRQEEEEAPSSAEATEGREESEEAPSFDETAESKEETENIAISDDADASADEEIDDSEEQTETGEEDEIVTDESAETQLDEPKKQETSVTEELSARIQRMANERFENDQWTQEYCTSHIGFCIPVHRNWWYKSFGTTTSYLWHVELSSEEVTDLYSGPIHINLVAGSIGSRKASDGQIRQDGPKIIGFRQWSDSRHFEISAPYVLKPAVEYITANLKTLEN